MPRYSKILPQDREDFSFGDLVYWHLFVYGTRPTGDPSAKAGRKWESAAICRLLGITEKTLGNWMADRHFPQYTNDLERELFGENSAWDDARLELAEALRRTRDLKRRKAASAGQGLEDPPSEQTQPDEDQPRQPAGSPSGRSLIPAVDDEESQPAGSNDLIIIEPHGEKFGKERTGSSPKAVIRREKPSARRPFWSRSRLAAVMGVTGITVALGMYAWVSNPSVNVATTVKAPPPKQPSPVPAPSPAPTPPVPTPPVKKLPPPPPPPPEPKPDACLPDNAKPAGFTITCDNILTGGTTLGSNRLTYPVATVNECASKCRPIERCVAFTVGPTESNGKRSCTLFGPTPEGRESEGWISGVR